MSDPWIQSRDGRVIDLIAPDLTELTIDEVAHSLARINRFTGHTRGPVPYNVAQHSCIVAKNLPQELQLAGLMHDAHESALGDISSPVKWALERWGGGRALKKLDDCLVAAFAARWNFTTGHPEVREADLRALITERRDVLGDVEAKPWGIMWEGKEVLPYVDEIIPWSVEESEYQFLRAFEKMNRWRKGAVR